MGHEQTVVRQMTADQVAKLRSELDVVQTNAQIFGEMLVFLQPGEEHPQDLELLMVRTRSPSSDCHAQCVLSPRNYKKRARKCKRVLSTYSHRSPSMILRVTTR